MTLPEEGFSILPDECLRRIFTLLPVEDKIQFERVCRKWEQIGAEEPWQIKQLDLRRFQRKNYSKILQRCGSCVKKLTIEFNNDEVPISALIKNHCRRLQKIVIIWNEHVEYPQVKHLDFFDNMDEVFENNERLKSVEICGYHAELVSHFVDYLRRDTKKLRIVICKTERKKNNLFPDFSIDVSRFRSLKILHVSGFLSVEQKTLRGLERLENLKELRLEFCLMSERVMNMISNLHNLENLHLKDSVGGAILTINEAHELFRNKNKQKFLSSPKKYQHSLRKI